VRPAPQAHSLAAKNKNQAVPGELMKHVAVVLLLLSCSSVPAADRAETSPLYWTYQHVLVTSDDELSVAQLVFDLPQMHPEMCDRAMLDLMAEFLVNANLIAPSYEKGIEEIFSILELGEAARYRTVAQQVEKKAKLGSIKGLAKNCRNTFRARSTVRRCADSTRAMHSRHVIRRTWGSSSAG
jgi:hypothetical protein